MQHIIASTRLIKEMHFSIIVFSIRGFRGYVFPSKFTICTHFYTRAQIVWFFTFFSGIAFYIR